MILAVDDVFVVPIPTSMKVIGLFRAAAAAIANNSRDEVGRQLAGAAPGWHAVAVGTRGRPGLKLKADTERDAVAGALAECAKQDEDCNVIAIGSFAVAPL